MDITKLLFTFEGRIGRQAFWIGWAILTAASIVLSVIPLLNLLGILLIYPKVCVYTKRLHDMGKSGWLQLIPYGVWIAAFVIGFMLFGASLVTMALQADGAKDNPAATMAMLGSMGGFFALLGLAVLVSLAFLLWVGCSASDAAKSVRRFRIFGNFGRLSIGAVIRLPKEMTMSIDWKSLFLSPEGRIPRQTYWMGWGCQFAAGLVIGALFQALGAAIGSEVATSISAAISLALLYPLYFVYAKRLHDLDKPAGIALIPVVCGVLNAAMAVYMVIVVGIKPSLNPMASAGDPELMQKMAAIMPFSLANSAIGLIGFVIWLWLGIAQGQEGPNRFGPDPRFEDEADAF